MKPKPGSEVKSFEKDGRVWPIITLNDESPTKFGFTFGVAKARLILKNIEAIRKFVEDCDKNSNLERGPIE